VAAQTLVPLSGPLSAGAMGLPLVQGLTRQAEPQDKVLTKGKEVRVPAETVLNFKRNADLHLEATRW
jgi:hypothetical protein